MMLASLVPKKTPDEMRIFPQHECGKTRGPGRTIHSAGTRSSSFDPPYHDTITSCER